MNIAADKVRLCLSYTNTEDLSVALQDIGSEKFYGVFVFDKANEQRLADFLLELCGEVDSEPVPLDLMTPVFGLD